MKSCGASSSDGGNTRGRSSLCYPDLAIPAMIPKATDLVVVHPAENSIPTETNAGDSGGLPPRAQPPASCLAYMYLRQRY